MITFLYLILGTYAVTMFTWAAYLAVMNLMPKRDQLSLATKCFAYPLAAVGVLADFMYNIIFGTILFLELPQEYLLTKRLKRHLERDNFRGSIARWLCANLLDPFDSKGTHCGKKPE